MIAMLHHIGSGPRITLDGSYHVQKSGSGVTSVSIKLEADGDIVSNGAAGVVDEGDWIAPKEAAGGDWEARMVTVSGTLDTGTADTWQALSSDLTYGLVNTVVGTTESFSGTLEIGRVGTSTALASCAVILEAERT
jgi:hypothetical protein